jgi:hypothetical protein
MCRDRLEFMVPFCGRMSYCYSKCLKMVLDWKGDSYPLPFLECLTTVPFGFVYIADAEKKGGFAVNGFNPHIGVRRALEALGYRYESRWFTDEDEALSYLQSALQQGPIILGPVDMGHLSYSPFRRFQAGSDHYLVLTDFNDGVPIVNDPDGFLQVPLPIEDLLRAWKAEGIGYREGPYSLWIIKGRERRPSKEELYRRTLQLGLQNLQIGESQHLGEGIMHQGARAIEKLAEDIKRYRSSRWLNFYAVFSFRVSAQRCFDSAWFIAEAPFTNQPLKRASQVRMEQAQLYGRAQWQAATKKFGAVAKTLTEIARKEKEFAMCLAKGLKG